MRTHQRETDLIVTHAGILIVSPSDVKLVAPLITVSGGSVPTGALFTIAATVSGTADCAFATGAVGGSSSVDASCSVAGAEVIPGSGAQGSFEDNFQGSQPVIALQLADSGQGATSVGGPGASLTHSAGGSAAPSASSSGSTPGPSPTKNGAMEAGLAMSSGWGVIFAAVLVLAFDVGAGSY